MGFGEMGKWGEQCVPPVPSGVPLENAARHPFICETTIFGSFVTPAGPCYLQSMSALLELPGIRNRAQPLSVKAWHHMIASSSIEAGKNGDQVGAVRNFFTHDGGNIREQLLALNDHRFLITYNILESGMGVSNYIAEISLQRVTSDNSTFAVWTAQFDCDREKEKELSQYISETVFQAGLANLHTVLSNG